MHVTESPKIELVAQFKDKEKRREYTELAYRFGDLVFEVLNAIGTGTRFRRLLIV